MAKIISVSNNKGGVGKTSVSVNLPVFLAAFGKKVLLVDFDHQANATYSLGIKPQNVEFSIYQALMGEVSPWKVVRRTKFFGYDIMPSNQDLAGAEVELVNIPNREGKLARVLQEVSNFYDYIIIDSPPSLGILTINALYASQGVIIPIQCEYLALEGLNQLLKTIDLVKSNLGHKMDFVGALLTMYSRWNRLSRSVAKEVRRNFTGYVFESVIPRSVSLAEAPRFGQTILQYAPKSAGAQAFRELAQEVINVEKKIEKNSKNQRPKTLNNIQS